MSVHTLPAELSPGPGMHSVIGSRIGELGHWMEDLLNKVFIGPKLGGAHSVHPVTAMPGNLTITGRKAIADGPWNAGEWHLKLRFVMHMACVVCSRCLKFLSIYSKQVRATLTLEFPPL